MGYVMKIWTIQIIDYGNSYTELVARSEDGSRVDGKDIAELKRKIVNKGRN